MSPARDLSDSAIVDHLPRILALIADFVEAARADTPVSLGSLPKAHAVDRLARGFDLDNIVTEYGLLRRTILDLWESRIGPTIDLSELRNLDISLDELLRQATVRYAEAREQLLKAVDRILPMARDKALTLRTDVPIDGVQVVADRNRILQVMANLLGNAIKFCDAGDVVTVRAETQDRDVLISVSDTGPGIPQQELTNIFEAYRTVERPGQSKSGTGLGLYIAKGVIERHGGRIWVESEIGVGTTFFFTLPRA